jgi:acyl dehydratase
VPLNLECIGRRYPSYRYEVSREKIREYAAATGVQIPEELLEDGDLIAPPTFAACLSSGRGASWASDPELGAHPALVHGAQEYDFHRPLRVGDVLICTPSIVNIASRSSTEILTAQLDCTDAVTGDPVVTARSTIVFFSEDA